jgi:hypothetical protein
MKPAVTPFDRATLELAFGRLGALAVAEGKVVEISIYVGPHFCLHLTSVLLRETLMQSSTMTANSCAARLVVLPRSLVGPVIGSTTA